MKQYCQISLIFSSVVLNLVLVNFIQKTTITRHCWQLGVLPTNTTENPRHWLVHVLWSAFLFVLVRIVLHLQSALSLLVKAQLLNQTPVAHYLRRKYILVWDVSPREGKGWEYLAMWLNCSAFSVVQFHVSWSFCIKLQYALLWFFHMECIFKCKLFLSYLSVFLLS